jgi:ketosteroid isomerase-like protein
MSVNKKVFYEFVSAINEHNVDKIYALMSDNHKFIDSYGNEVSGREQMKAGWTSYFNLFPDYEIEIIDLFVENDTIGAFGFASGGYKNKGTNTSENSFHIPAAWRVIIDRDKIKLWQVYADTRKQIDIIENNK